MEDIVIAHLEKIGDVKLISEEAGELVFGEPEVVVVADPLDGSFNAKHGLPLFAISLALAVTGGKNRIESAKVSDKKLGYVKNLISGDEYWAELGRGAYKNGNRFHVANASRLKVFAVELSPYHKKSFNRYAKLMDENSRIRCIGSLALDLCYTAEGIFDCLLDLRGNSCRIVDTLAGILIVEEAGGFVTDDNGNSIDNIPLNVNSAFNLVGSGSKDVHEKIILALAE